MEIVGNALRNIATTKVAQAYLGYRNKSETLIFDHHTLDPLLQDLWIILLTPKIMIREGARDLNVRLDGEMQIMPGYHHHTRRYGLLTSYESILLSTKVETYLRQQVYTDIMLNSSLSAAKVIDMWSERLELDPSWSEKTIRTYRNHKIHNYPVFA